jgi:hypothetical protein
MGVGGGVAALAGSHPVCSSPPKRVGTADSRLITAIPTDPTLFILVRGRGILRSSQVGRSRKFGLLLTVAVMFADGALVLLVGPDMRVREGRRALHSLLVHP